MKLKKFLDYITDDPILFWSIVAVIVILIGAIDMILTTPGDILYKMFHGKLHWQK